MVRRILFILLLFPMISFGGNVSTPKSLVLSYIHDFNQWNDEAYRLSEAEVKYTGEATKKAQALYQANIITKYCQQGFKGQPIAFGSHSNHDSEREEIITEIIDGDNAVITTKHTDDQGFVADYEYRLFKKNGRWFLGAVDYVDPDGKYPGL